MTGYNPRCHRGERRIDLKLTYSRMAILLSSIASSYLSLSLSLESAEEAASDPEEQERFSVPIYLRPSSYVGEPMTTKIGGGGGRSQSEINFAALMITTSCCCMDDIVCGDFIFCKCLFSFYNNFIER